MASAQRKAADDFSATFPLETVQKWRKMVKEWQTNPSRPNPYVSKERGMFFEGFSVAMSHGRSASIETFRGPIAVDSR